MPLVQLSQVCLAYGHVPLLDHVDLVIEPGERIGLIGRNGTGKSSLLKIIAGESAPDDGKIWRAPELKLASVSQEPAFRPGQSVFEAVAEGLGRGTQLLVDYHAATHALADAHDDADPVGTPARSCRKRSTRATAGAWSTGSKPRCRRLRLVEDRAGIGPFRRTEEARRAGARAGARAGSAAAGRADQPSRCRGDRMAGRDAAVLFRQRAVRHPRPALSRQRGDPDHRTRPRPPERVQRKLQRLSGRRKARRSKPKPCRTASSTSFWRRRKSGSARASKRAGRATKAGCGAWRRCGLERAARRERVGKVELAVDEGERSGKLVVELRNVGKRYGDKRVVVQDFSCRILRGDKVGLIGPNGSGKTTLLKLILGEIAARRRAGAPRHQARLRLFRPVPRGAGRRRRRSPTPSARAASSSKSTACAST